MTNPEQLTRINRSEPNPYRPDVPDKFRDISPELYQHLREISETLREQHNLTQVGDSTFSWEILTYVDAAVRYNVGSLGRFFHPTFGIIHARYCQFQGMRDTEFLGGPLGLYTDGNPLHWSVTNDFAKTVPDLVVGVGGFFTLPKDGNFGWVIANGVNVQQILFSAGSAPNQFDKLIWESNDVVTTAQEGDGKILGSILGTTTFDVQSASVWKIPPGYMFVDLQGDSEKRIKTWIDEAIADITTRMGLAESKITDLQNGLAALTVRVGAVETKSENNRLALIAEQSNRQLAINALTKRIDLLPVTGGSGGSDINLRNDFTTYVTTTDGILANYGNRINSLESSRDGFAVFKTYADQAIDDLKISVGRISNGLFYLTFNQLTDVPATYVGQANKYVRVKATEDGLEFAIGGFLPIGGATGTILRKVSAVDYDASWQSLTAGITVFTPTGGVASTNVQAAIAEIDAEKIPLVGPTVDNTIVRFDGVAGLIQTSLVTIDDAGAVGTPESCTITANVVGKGWCVTTYDSATPTNGSVNLFSRAGGTIAVPAATVTGSYLGAIRFQNFTTIFKNSALIRVVATEAGTTGSGAKFEFLVAPNGGGVTALALTIDQDKTATFVNDVKVPDLAYNATTWDASLSVPTRNAIRDKIEAMTLGVPGIVTNAVDANATTTWNTDKETTKLTAVLTANRTMTLAGGVDGAQLRFAMTGVSAFTWSIGGLKNLITNSWCLVGHNGTSWSLLAYGTL